MSRSTFDIEVDRNACRGAAVCVRLAPGSFSLDAQNRSEAIRPPMDGDGAIRDAADRCPYFAIQLIPREPAEVSSVG